MRRAGDTRVEGLADLDRRAAALPAALTSEVRKAMTRNGAALAKRLRTIAPRDKGDLVASIEAVEGPGPLAVTVREGTPETPAPHVEYGHLAQDGSHVAAVPHFWPAYQVEKKAIRGRVVRATNAAIKQITGKGRSR